VQFARKHIDSDSARQYSNEELALLRKRYRLSQARIEELLEVMATDKISTQAHVHQLAAELAGFHGVAALGACQSMGHLLGRHLKLHLGLE